MQDDWNLDASVFGELHVILYEKVKPVNHNRPLSFNQLVVWLDSKFKRIMLNLS